MNMAARVSRCVVAAVQINLETILRFEEEMHEASEMLPMSPRC